MNKVKIGYISELDGMRGLAVLCVMAYHANAPFLRGGFIGVDLFFVISGFLISALIVSEYDAIGSVNLLKFYMRRVIRLMPALSILLIVYCIGVYLFCDPVVAEKNYIDAMISMFYMTNWARAFDLHPPDFLGHTWSLAVEEQFYFLWPLTLFALLKYSGSTVRERFNVMLFPIFVACCSFCYRFYLALDGASPDRMYNGLDTRADALMMGCALGICYASGLIGDWLFVRFGTALKLFSTLALIATLFFGVFASWRAKYMYTIGFFVVDLSFVLLLTWVLFHKTTFFSIVFNNKFIVWVGGLSYGLYLWHYPVFRTMYLFGWGGAVVLTVGSAISFVLAYSSLAVVERPVLRLKKRYVVAA